MQDTNSTRVDVPTAKQLRDMSEHFAECEGEYRGESRHCEVVYEDDLVVVVADHAGYEHTEWADAFGIDRSEFSRCMHDLASEVCAYDWSASDPLVFDKLEGVGE